MTLTSIINTMTDVVTIAVPWVLVFLIFYWNVYKIIFEGDNAEKRKQALPRLIWSIVALAVIFSLGGIINIISNTLLGSSSSTFAPSSSSPSSESPELLGGPRSGTRTILPGSFGNPQTSPFNPNLNDPGFERVPPTSPNPNRIQDI